jgi:hypothetical protein
MVNRAGRCALSVPVLSKCNPPLRLTGFVSSFDKPLTGELNPSEQPTPPCVIIWDLDETLVTCRSFTDKETSVSYPWAVSVCESLASRLPSLKDGH